MIPNHTQFIAAIKDRKKVCVRFYSQPDNGVLDRVSAPMDYGPGGNPDGLNRYWLWVYTNETGPQTIGLLPQQILDLQVLGETFDPAQFMIGPPRGLIPPPDDLPAVKVISTGGVAVPIL